MKISLPSHTARFLAAALLVVLCNPCPANWFGGKQDLPQWGLDAAKTPTPAYVKDAAVVVLFDEYLETVDAQGRAVERERMVKRIHKPQGRSVSCDVQYDVDEKINYFREWTIAADQKQYQAQDTDFIDVGDTGIPIMLSTRKARVVRPPAADVGATIVCESEKLLPSYLQEGTGIFSTPFPSSSRPLRLTCPPAVPIPRHGTDTRPSSPSRSLPTIGAGRLKICPPSTSAR